MKLKKLLAVLLALALAMTCLVSCSKDSDKDEGKSTHSKKISVEDAESKEDEPAVEEDSDEALEEPIENIVEFYETANGDCIFDAFPSVLVDQLSDEEKESVNGMVKEYKDVLDQVDSISVDYKIVDKKELSKEELDDFRTSLEGMLKESDEDVEVTAGYSCTIEISLTGEAGGKESTETQEMEMNIYKVNGEWSIDPTSL